VAADERSTIKRSFEMVLASYYLSRCGDVVDEKASGPPKKLGVKSWKDAYELFFDAMGDGREQTQFRNSLKNARDTFDVLFDNGRIGWVNAEGRQPDLSPRFMRIHDEWANRPDFELEAFVLKLLTGSLAPEDGSIPGATARTEGGVKVRISRQRERNPKLRNDAIRIHGLSCQGCGFNFSDAYGDLGAGFIEVHHMVPLANAEKRKTNPETDLAVLCSNCHRMVHRKKDICLSLDELKSVLRIRYFNLNV
jgi:hypothetical protein